MYKAETERYRVHHECPMTGRIQEDKHLRNSYRYSFFL